MTIGLFAISLVAETSVVTPVNGAEVKKSDRTMPPPRDPEVAVREEFDLAQKRGTIEAWQLFIERHPDDPLAAKARQEIEQIRRKHR